MWMASQDSQQSEVLALLKDVAASSLDILRTLKEQNIGTSDSDEDVADRHPGVETTIGIPEVLNEPHTGADMESVSIDNQGDDASVKNVCDMRSSQAENNKDTEDLNEETEGTDEGQLKEEEEGSDEGLEVKSTQDINYCPPNMSMDFVLYGSKLRRKRVEMQNDNRMCVMFESTESLAEENRPVTGELTSDDEDTAEAGLQQTSDDEESSLMKVFAENYWVKYANEEIKRARDKVSLKETGMDTVICLDMSDSMTGEGWKQAIDFINNFLDGIMAQTTLRDEAFENIALITFGKETCVQQYLTCDLIGVKQKLNKLTPGGKSPLKVGLLLCQAVLIGSAGVLRYFNLRLAPRVFLVTDGHFTSSGSSLMDGPDRCDTPLDFLERLSIRQRTAEIKKGTKANIYPVPVGNCDVSILEEIAKHSDGAIVPVDDFQKYVTTFKNFRTAGKLSITIQQQPWLQSVDGMGDILLSSQSEADKEQIKFFLENNMRVDEDSDSDGEETYSSLPLGVRVQKNKPASGDRTLVGTVTKHMSNDYIGVTWDRTPYGGDGPREKVLLHELHKVDTARKLRSELIAVGCRVKRGPDWQYPDQDGGDGRLGYVFKVKPTGIVNVRWDIGTKNTYRFGSGGSFDLEIIDNQDEAESPEEPGGAHGTIIRPQIDEAPATDIKAIEEEMNKKNAQMILEESDSVEQMNKMNKMNLQNAQRVDSTEQKALEEDKRLSAVKIVSQSKNCADSVEQSTAESPNVSAVPVTSEENRGARPKVIASVIREKSIIQWQWQDGGTMRSYPDEMNAKIEDSYQRNSAGSVLILMDQQQYRIIFKRMEQVNIQSRDKTTVVRTSQ